MRNDIGVLSVFCIVKVADPGGFGGGMGAKVNSNGSLKGDLSGPLQLWNALKYTVPLVNDEEIGKTVPIDAENVWTTEKSSNWLIDPVILTAGFKVADEV